MRSLKEEALSRMFTRVSREVENSKSLKPALSCPLACF